MFRSSGRQRLTNIFAVPLVGILFGLSAVKVSSSQDAEAQRAGAEPRPAEESADAAEARPEFQETRALTEGLENTLLAALAELRELSRESAAAAASMSEKLDASSVENERLGTVLADTWRKLNALEEEKGAVEDRSAELMERLQQSQADVAGLNERLETSNEARSDAEARLAETREELDRLNTETAQLKHELRTTQSELGSVQAAFAEAQEARDQARLKAEAVRTQFLAVMENLDALASSEEGADAAPVAAGSRDRNSNAEASEQSAQSEEISD